MMLRMSAVNVFVPTHVLCQPWLLSIQQLNHDNLNCSWQFASWQAYLAATGKSVFLC